MKLYEAIEYAINKNGTDIICEQRLQITFKTCRHIKLMR